MSLSQTNLKYQGSILAAQQALRSELLDKKKITDAGSRDLASHLLLYIDDLDSCWSIATQWLRDKLNCSRVDTGFGSPSAKEYFPSYAEAKSRNYSVPTLGNSAVDNRDRAMQAMWFADKPLIFEDIKQDRRIEMGLRQRLSNAETKSKFAAVLRVGDKRFGLICADWTKEQVPWESHIYDQFYQTVSEVLCPIIFVAHDLNKTRLAYPPEQNEALDRFRQIGHPPGQLKKLLTQAEIEVAVLVAQGVSYKEIANRRGKSFSTVDHQLRSIRKKLNVSTTAQLISLLGRHKV